MKPFNQFDMEQQIMTCWNICEDLETLNEGVLDREITRDQIANIVQGMKDLYHLKFETLFESFEAMCREHYRLRNQAKEGTDTLEAYSYTNYERDDDNMNSAHGVVL